MTIRAELRQHLRGPERTDQRAQWNNCLAEANKDQSCPSHRHYAVMGEQPSRWHKSQRLLINFASGESLSALIGVNQLAWNTCLVTNTTLLGNTSDLT